MITIPDSASWSSAGTSINWAPVIEKGKTWLFRHTFETFKEKLPLRLLKGEMAECFQGFRCSGMGGRICHTVNRVVSSSKRRDHPSRILIGVVSSFDLRKLKRIDCDGQVHKIQSCNRNRKIRKLKLKIIIFMRTFHTSSNIRLRRKDSFLEFV